MYWSLKKLKTKIISPEISSPQVYFADFVPGLLKSRNSVGMTGADTGNSYNLGLPISLNIFAEISKSFSIKDISDNDVRAKTIEILNTLNKSIVAIPDVFNIQNCFSKLHLVEQEDKSVLIEWAYRNFRIGFVVCTPVDDSYYFFVAKNADAFESKSTKIGDNLNILTQELVQYVIRNT
ncbi:MAG: hypothetical protein MdMp014T_2700 [Treponematales bacterium]